MIGVHNKQRINPIDVLVVLLLILIIVTSIFFYSERNTMRSRTVCDVEYQIVIASIPDDIVNNMSTGDMLYDSLTSHQIGTVTGAKVEYSESGIAQLTLDIKAKANKHDEHVSIGGISLIEGEYIDFRSLNLAYGGIVENINIISDQGV